MTSFIKTWDNRTPRIDEQTVLITNGDTQEAFVPFERYDDRSSIENNLFRDTKQNWDFEDPPKKSKQAVFVQVYMVMAMKALATSFLIWQEEQSRLHGLAKLSSWEMYRRKLKAVNRNELIALLVHTGILLRCIWVSSVFILYEILL